MKTKVFFSQHITPKHVCRLWVIVCVLLATHCNWAWGQTSNFTTNANSLASSGSLIDSFFIKKAKFVDNYNNSYTYEDLKLKQQQPNSFQCAPSSTSIFNLTFVDNEEIYFFEDPEVVTTICQVFQDLSGLIERRSSPCQTNDAKVEINLVEGEIYVGNSTTPDPNVAARGFTYYQWMPDSYADDGIVDKGIVDNLAWQVINTGYPPGITGMIGSGFYHGEIRFNPTAVMGLNWNPDFTTTSMPPNTNIDLYSTTLHEALHVLGFDSGIDATGAASLEFTVPASTDTYKRYDMFLESGNNFLITNPNVLADPYNWTFTGNTANLVDASDGCSIDYDYNGSAYPIHTPSTFSGGSLRHLDNDCATLGANYVMHPIVLNAIHRTPTPEEVNILCSLGYKTSQYYGTYTNGQWSHNHEFYTSCDNNMPIGITNYRPNCSSEDYTITMCQNPSSITIPFSEILGNDINVTENTTITGINIIDVTQSLSISVSTTVYGDHFTLTVENVGTLDVENAEIWLKYVPVTIAAGGTLLGNVSYINVKVVGCCFPNIPPAMANGCNLIPNPTLQISSDANCNYDLKHNVGNYNQCVAGWARLNGSPGCGPSDVIQNNITANSNWGNVLVPMGEGSLRQQAEPNGEKDVTITEVDVDQNKNYIRPLAKVIKKG